MIRIAQASSSENYGRYGTAPNQRRTGVTASKPQGNLDGELNIISWKGGWECVYRAIDEEVAEKIAEFNYRAVANGSGIGYSWSGNTGLFDALKKLGSTNPADVKTPVNTDCAALEGAAIYNAGIHDDRLRTLTTAKIDEVLMSTGCFIKLTGKELCEKGKGIRRGDLVWKTGHVACVLDTDPIDYSEMFYYQKLTFNNVSIPAGDKGERAVQMSKAIGKSGYRPIVARLASVSYSALVNIQPFLGGGGEDKLYVNYYRANGESGKVDCTVIVVYVRKEFTKTSW